MRYIASGNENKFWITRYKFGFVWLEEEADNFWECVFYFQTLNLATVKNYNSKSLPKNWTIT